MNLILRWLVTGYGEKPSTIARGTKMTDENNPTQDDNSPDSPPPPEVVELDPRIVQKGDMPEDLEK